MSPSSPVKPLREAPQDLASCLALEQTLTLPQFTSEDAFQLGLAIRSRIQQLYPASSTSTSPSPSAAISITTANTSNLLFHATTGPQIIPDNDTRISRKRATVLRFGMSSWAMGRKFDADQEKFSRTYMLRERAGEYAIHGGAVPIRVERVEGVVAVVVVSGLKQVEDHMVVVEGLEGLRDSLRGSVETKEAEEEEEGKEAEVENGDGNVEGRKDVMVPSTEDAKAMVAEQKADGAVFAS